MGMGRLPAPGGSTMSAYAAKKAAQGLCGQSACKNPKPEGKSTCQACIAKIAGLRRKLKAERRTLGLCIYCGSPPKEGGYKMCEACQAKAHHPCTICPPTKPGHSVRQHVGKLGLCSKCTEPAMVSPDKRRLCKAHRQLQW